MKGGESHPSSKPAGGEECYLESAIAESEAKLERLVAMYKTI